MWFFHYNALVNAVASTIFGTIAFAKNPHDPKNRTYAFYCFSLSLWSYFYVYWQLSTTAQSALWFSRGLMVGAILIPIAHVHHLLRLFDWKAPRLLGVGYTLCAFFLMASATPLFVKAVEPRLYFPHWPVPGPLFHPYLLCFFLCLGYCLWMIEGARRKATGYQRNLLSWVFWATLIGYGGGASNFPLWYNLPVPPLGNCLVTLYTTTVFYILSRYRLMDISIIVRRTLVYTAVMGSLTMVYLVTISVAAHLFEGMAGYSTVFSSAVAAALMTFCFQPLRKKVQTLVDAKFFRQYVDREEKLYELSRDVMTHTTPEAMADALMRVLGETLHPKRAVLYLQSKDGSGFRAVSSVSSTSLPERMPEDNPLARYFADHPQPFLQDQEGGGPQNTRRDSDKGRAA